MCRHGDTVPVLVKIPADLSCTGNSRMKSVEIDRCIAPIVIALQAQDIDMRGSCCGHGKADGLIELQDGRQLVVKNVTGKRR